MSTNLHQRKILFVLGNYNQGGAERQAVYLAKWLKEERNCKVSFTAFSGKGKVCDILDSLSIPWNQIPFNFHFIDEFGPFRLNKRSISYFFKLWKAVNEYAGRLRKLQPDIILPYTYYPNVVCGLSWTKTGAKACIWNQRDIGSDGMNGGYPESKAVHQTSWFISNSTQGAGLLKKRFKISSDKIDIIHNGIVIPQEPHIQAMDFGLTPGDEKIVMLGNFHINKDHDTLIEAWKIVTNELPQRKLMLILAGNFGGTQVLLKKKCGKLGIASKVKFLDSVNDIYGLLSICNFSVFSSKLEGLPNAVLEAMAAGKAVVATDIDGCREALGDQYPLLAEAGNSDEMAKMIINLLKHKRMSDKLGEKNRNRIRSEFSIEKMGNAYQSKIELLLSEKI